MIIYVIPEYIEELGDCSRVCSDEGEKVCKRKLHTVIRELYRERYMDFEAIKSRIADLLNQKNLIPLYLSEKEVLIPVKIRRPRVLKDCTYGYVNIGEIAKITEKEILLKNNRRINFYDTNRIIKRRIKLAGMLAERFKQGLNNYEVRGRDEHGFSYIVEYILKELSSIKYMMERYISPLTTIEAY